MKRLSIFALALILTASAAHGQARRLGGLGGAVGKATPSENAGRRDTYQATTSNPQYTYYVSVPKSYDETRGAGIHLYFHGQNGQGGAPHFGQWQRSFLEPYGLIGINMCYADGDNAADTGGKVTAAQEAIAQVLADYHIVVGRGVVCSFSGGGLPLAQFYGSHGQRGPSEAWPFSHMALYSSNFRGSVGRGRMSGFVSVGGGEWGLAELGKTQTMRARELFNAAARGGCPDVYFKVIAKKGHSIAKEDVAGSAEVFRRFDLAFNPFVYEAAFENTQVRSIAQQANRMALGTAERMVNDLVSDEKTDDPAKQQAQQLKPIIDQHVADVLAMARQLAESDPILFDFYGPHLTKQLRGHSKPPEMDEINKTFRQSTSARAYKSGQGAFYKTFNVLLKTDAPTFDAKHIPTLKKIQELVGEQSLYGRMCAELLELAPYQE